ncbi:MAG: glycosyltransferase [Candidatus Dojkabacteria bacterium]|nr:glycosyltransferase [Candidatus Dojkabacteria bacterium]
MKQTNKRNFEKLNVALVDDFLTTDGGAQKVLRVLHEMWPNAPVYTTVYNPERFTPPLDGWDIRTSFVDRLPGKNALEQQYKLFYPLAVERLDLSSYDLVISSTYAGYSKAVITPPECLHISYVQTVPRFLWGYRTSRHDRLGWLYRSVILPPLEHYWRIWDRQTSVRPDVLAANSKNIARRIRKFYRRDCEVLYPPADIDALLKLSVPKEDYFIYFGRLEKYKCIDMAIRSVFKAKQKLIIVGTGSHELYLKDLVSELHAEKYVTFLGWLSGGELRKRIAQAKGFIFPGPDEDFGLVMVEALAAGTPVIAFNMGGAAEIVEHSVTGILIDSFSQELLDRSVAEFNLSTFSMEACRDRAKFFSTDVFKKRILSLIEANL